MTARVDVSKVALLARNPMEFGLFGLLPGTKAG